MKFIERVAYLKGLAEGLELEADAKTTKLLSAVIDSLGTLADELGAISSETEELSRELDDVADRLDDVEEIVFGMDDYDFDDDDDDDDDDDEWCDCCDDDDDDDEITVGCENCGADIVISEDELFAGETKCPKCGEKIEFDFDDEDDE
ncbi:MAG: hypothetical protein LBS51_06820 [Oscillospiraceae bacterium]|jgi:DNA-directed RNA polymerase subunit RPC12/RpoP|nr:hypothetical protein [Oscillospiraceae bacterium]